MAAARPHGEATRLIGDHDDLRSPAGSQRSIRTVAPASDKDQTVTRYHSRVLSAHVFKEAAGSVWTRRIGWGDVRQAG